MGNLFKDGKYLRKYGGQQAQGADAGHWQTVRVAAFPRAAWSISTASSVDWGRSQGGISSFRDCCLVHRTVRTIRSRVSSFPMAFDVAEVHDYAFAETVDFSDDVEDLREQTLVAMRDDRDRYFLRNSQGR